MKKMVKTLSKKKQRLKKNLEIIVLLKHLSNFFEGVTHAID